MKYWCLVLMVLLMFSIIGCSPSSETADRIGPEEEFVHTTRLSSGGTIVYIHDEEREVGIWLFIGGLKAGLAVLPDSEYKSEK